MNVPNHHYKHLKWKFWMLAGGLGMTAWGILLGFPTELHYPKLLADTSGGELDAAHRIQINEAYGKLPLTFEINQGQTDAQVKFLSRGSGYALFLTPTETVLVLNKPQLRYSAVSQSSNNPLKRTTQTNPTVLRMQLVGANSQPQVTGLKELPSQVNYFTGNNSQQWQSNIPTYAKVQYQKVYPNVDLVYYGNQRQLEYDFVVAPGGNPNLITLKFQGSDKLEVDAQGDLLLHAAGEQVRMHKPVVYQELDGIRQEIASRYVLRGNNQVGFQVAAYDSTRTLVIDPVLTYSTYLGGSGSEREGNDIAVDASGNAYVTGSTQSLNFPMVNSLQPNFGGGQDAFVTKISADGSMLVYSTYLGGSASEDGFGIAVDTLGNAYVTGDTNSLNFPTVNPLQPAIKVNANGVFYEDAFVAKISADGSTLLYSTYLGGSSRDNGADIAVDRSGNAYVTGGVTSEDFLIENALQPVYGGVADAFVTKISADGSALIYSTYLGGSSSENPEIGAGGIAVDDLGNAYVTGFTQSTNFPRANALQITNAGYYDAFVTKLNSTGSVLLYSTYLGGNGYDTGNAIAVDTSGNAYVTGLGTSANFPTLNALQPTLGGGQDAFVTKLNSTGSALVYSTYLGGSSDDEGNGIAVTNTGSAYVTGRTDSRNFPVKNADQLQLFKRAVDEAFVTKLSPTGSTLVYSTYLGGIRNDEGTGIAVDTFGNAYVTGFTQSTDFPTANALQPTFGGGQDAFVAKIKLTTDSLTASPASINPFEGNLTQEDCPPGTLLQFLPGGYACVEK
jgi:hypothetical protein